MSELNPDIDSIIKHVIGLPEERVVSSEIKLLHGKHLFDIEASSICNLRCRFCPEHIKRPRGIMSEDTINKLIHWIPRGSDTIISGLGEPLINPRLDLLIKGLKGRDIGVSIITNGQLLSAEQQLKLINAGVDEIQVSLHTLDPAEYERITSKPLLTNLLKNLEALKRTHNANIKVRINCVINDNTTNILAGIDEYTKREGFELFIRRVHSRGGSVYTQRGHINSLNSYCGILPCASYITWDGDILSCSNDVDGTTRCGNVSTHNFEEVIAAKICAIQKGKLPEICMKCNDDYRYLVLYYGGVNFEQ